MTNFGLRLSSIGAKLVTERNRLGQLKTDNLGISQSPLLQNMYKTPVTPPKYVLVSRKKVDETFYGITEADFPSNVVLPLVLDGTESPNLIQGLDEARGTSSTLVPFLIIYPQLT